MEHLADMILPDGVADFMGYGFLGYFSCCRVSSGSGIKGIVGARVGPKR